MINTAEKYIPRPDYTDKIRPFVGTHIIKVLTGQRRAGKSFILYELMDEIRQANPEANIIYINTELAQFNGLQNWTDLYDYIKAGLKLEFNFVFIDEIQEIREFERAVQSLFAEGSCDIFITGSNSRLLSGELATFLAGRYIQFRIHPLRYREFLNFYQCPASDSSLRRYLEFGGMPYLASIAALPSYAAMAREYLENIYDSIILRDVVARENIRNVNFLKTLVPYVSDNTGNLFSATNISKYLKNQRVSMPVPTIINYLSALETAMLIHKVPRAEINGLKIFEIGEKYYFEDLGLRNILAREEFPAGIEKIIENAVYLDLIQKEWKVQVGKTGALEVDFVAEKEKRKIYIQAAYRLDSRATREREIEPFKKIEDGFPKYIVSLDDALPSVTKEGYRCLRLGDFLLTDY
jgi:predicted AAA+ superfamily ATPase